MTELFIAGRDAGLDNLVTTGQVKTRGAWKLPAYVRADAPAPVRSPASRDAALAKLGAMFPGMVKRPN